MQHIVTSKGCYCKELTFERPVSTGMRNLTSDTRLWYKSRTLSTNACDGAAVNTTKQIRQRMVVQL